MDEGDDEPEQATPERLKEQRAKHVEEGGRLIGGLGSSRYGSLLSTMLCACAGSQSQLCAHTDTLAYPC
jgi:hypothetical protein